jgi:hypothetical protein
MVLYNLLNSDASFSISGEEHIDGIVYSTLDKNKMDDYIKDNNITLGRSHLYDNNYQYFTIVESNLDISEIKKGSA